MAELVWFSTGRRTRKAKNLFGNRRCIIGTEVADEAVILEGTVESVPDRIILKQLIDIHNRKYGGDLEPLVESLVSLVFRVTPQTIFGQDERAENFGGRHPLEIHQILTVLFFATGHRAY